MPVHTCTRLRGKRPRSHQPPRVPPSQKSWGLLGSKNKEQGSEIYPPVLYACRVLSILHSTQQYSYCRLYSALHCCTLHSTLRTVNREPPFVLRGRRGGTNTKKMPLRSVAVCPSPVSRNFRFGLFWATNGFRSPAPAGPPPEWEVTMGQAPGDDHSPLCWLLGLLLCCCIS